MNNEEALKQFVQTNLPLLTSPSFVKQAYKEALRKAFNDKHRKRFGLPTTKEVAEALIILLKRRGVPAVTIANHIESLPFFKELGAPTQQRLLAIVQSDKHKSALGEEELDLVKKGAVFEAVEHHKGKQIETQVKQKIQELEVHLKQKQEEYEAYPSVLDATPFEEPSFDPEEDMGRAWWERFYLKENPFPRKDGLSSVDQDLYERVVVKTKPFLEMIAKLSRDKSCLFNTAFLLVGDFGFGKTTFLDYLSYHLVRMDILPVRVTSTRLHTNASGFLDSFFLRLFDLLRQELAILGVPTPQAPESSYESGITTMCSLLTQRRAGVVVILDDYHKFRSSLEAVLEFLGLLQIFKDELTRLRHPVGFIVAGLPEWTLEAAKRSQLSGFLDSPVVTMPAITPESITKVFNQRIAAYCYDAHPRLLRQEFVESVFDKIGGTSGYRDYLNRIVDELEHNNFAILDSPISLLDDELAVIRSTFESDPTVKAAVSKLLHESLFKRFTAQQINKCLELLVQLHVHDGIAENEPIFALNVPYFLHLRDFQFLQKRKGKSKANGPAFFWVLQQRFQQAIDLVRSRTNRDFTDYFLKLYAGEAYRTQNLSGPDVHTGSPANPLAKASSLKLSKAIRDNLHEASRLFESVSEDSPFEHRDAVIARLQGAIDFLCKAFFELDGSLALFSRAKISTTDERLSSHWLATESIQETFSRFNGFKADPSRLQFEKTLKQGLDTFNYMASQFVSLALDICEESRVLPYRNKAIRLTGPELAILEQAQRGYFAASGESHFDYVTKITDLLEKRFREFLFVTTNLVFGEKDYFAHVPTHAKNYAHRNIEGRTIYSAVINLFHGFTRPQFRTVFTEGPISKLICDMIVQWEPKEWKLFFEMFIVENIATSHKQIAAYSPEERDRYERYCRLACELLAKMNQFVANIIQEGAYIDDTRKPADISVDTCRFCYGFYKKPGAKPENGRFIPKSSAAPEAVTLGKVIVGADQIYSHTVPRPAYDKVMGQVRANVSGGRWFTEDLLDIEYLRTHYDVTITELICALTYAFLVTQEIEIQPWFGSSILIRER